jgi:hypothetical protein
VVDQGVKQDQPVALARIVSVREPLTAARSSTNSPSSLRPRLRPPGPPRRAPLFVRDQAYYWTMEWQRAEAEALREIAEGKALRFSSGAAAAEWLLTDGDE